MDNKQVIEKLIQTLKTEVDHEENHLLHLPLETFTQPEKLKNIILERNEFHKKIIYLIDQVSKNQIFKKVEGNLK